MKQLLIYLRFAQLFGHNCHNFTTKPTFFSDHAFFGDFYGAMEGYYDSVAERMIGIDESFDPIEVQVSATMLLKQVKYPLGDNQACFEACLSLCKEINGEIERLCKPGKYSEGTRQLLGGMADQIEMQIYKIKQRLKG